MLPLAIMLMDDESDRAFIERMYFEHRSMLWHTAYRYLQDEHRAEDLVDDVIVQAIAHIDILRSMNNVVIRSYLYTTAVHLSLNCLKRERRQIVTAEPLTDTDDVNASVEDEVLLHASQQELKAAMMRLSEADRKILQWKYFYAWKDEDVAAYLNVSKQSVRTYVMRARRRLKDVLKEVGWND